MKMYIQKLTCGGEYAANNATEAYEKRPQRHVIFCDRHHQGADVILHEYTRNTMAARGMINYTLLQKQATQNRVSASPMAKHNKFYQTKLTQRCHL